MTELNDNTELQLYSSAVLYVVSAVTPPPEYVDIILNKFLFGIKSATASYKFYCP
jgi:proteasome activator subunit 4